MTACGSLVIATFVSEPCINYTASTLNEAISTQKSGSWGKKNYFALIYKAQIYREHIVHKETYSVFVVFKFHRELVRKKKYLR